TTFRVGPSDRTRVAALLGYLHQAKPELRSMAMLGGDDGAEALDRLLAGEAPRSGLTYAGRAGAADAEPGPALQQLAGQGVQAVFLPGPRQAAVAAAQAVQQLSLGGRLVPGGCAS